MSHVRFRYDDFVKKANLMPAGYSSDVLNNARREGPDLIMSTDAYRHIQDRHKTTVQAPSDVAEKLKELAPTQRSGCKTCGKPKS